MAELTVSDVLEYTKVGHVDHNDLREGDMVEIKVTKGGESETVLSFEPAEDTTGFVNIIFMAAEVPD